MKPYQSIFEYIDRDIEHRGGTGRYGEKDEQAEERAKHTAQALVMVVEGTAVKPTHREIG